MTWELAGAIGQVLASIALGIALIRLTREVDLMDEDEDW